MDTQTVTKVFPANVRGPFGALDETAVILAGDRVLVFVAASGLPRLVAETTVEGLDHDAARRVTFSLTDTEGQGWVIRAGGGCGCSNPLKRMSAEAILATIGG